MERDEFTCIICKSKTKTLNVHHLRYIKNRDPWEYENDDLLTICEECHSEVIPEFMEHVNTFTRLMIRQCEGACWITMKELCKPEFIERIYTIVPLLRTEYGRLLVDTSKKLYDEKGEI